MKIFSFFKRFSLKERAGADFLIKEGWNLSEDEAEFGNNRLNL